MAAMTKATDLRMEIQGLGASGGKFFQTDSSSSKLGPVPNRRMNSSTQFIHSLLPSHTQTSQNCRTCRKVTALYGYGRRLELANLQQLSLPDKFIYQGHGGFPFSHLKTRIVPTSHGAVAGIKKVNI